MEFSFSNRIRAAENVLIRELDGESVLLNLDTEKYFGLDDVASRMWSVLNTTDNIQATCDQLAKEYDVSEDQLKEDLGSLVSELIEHGLVEIQPR